MEAGRYLYASCSATCYRILAVGKDANGRDCLTMEVPDVNDFLEFGEDWQNLMRVEPCAVTFRDVPWERVKGSPDQVRLWTPGDGCYRCTKLFSIRPC